MKKNCWEFMECGREIGGQKTGELGVCPAAMEKKLDGSHGGRNGGRACWVIAGTLCKGEIQGTFALKYHNCIQCKFYNQVKSEEQSRFSLAATLISILK